MRVKGEMRCASEIGPRASIVRLRFGLVGERQLLLDFLLQVHEALLLQYLLTGLGAAEYRRLRVRDGVDGRRDRPRLQLQARPRAGIGCGFRLVSVWRWREKRTADSRVDDKKILNSST